MRRFISLTGFALAVSVAACGTVDYDTAPVGRFEGSLFVMWIGEGGSSGDGAFVYVPNPAAPLTFTRSGGLPFGEIAPEMMYTDGGSIPKPAQLFRGFSPWGYAPGYMIHDWLFVARHCNLDGTPTNAERRMAGMEFQTSANIMAETIKTLLLNNRISQNDIAPRAISSAVAGFISSRIWNEEGACAASRVSEEDRLAAEAGIPGSSVPLGEAVRTRLDGTQVPLRAGQVVGSIDF